MIYTKNNKAELIKPYQSTLAFDKFINFEIRKVDTIVDIGSGEGATINFYIKKYKDKKFIVTDYQKAYLKNSIILTHKIT